MASVAIWHLTCCVTVNQIFSKVVSYFDLSKFSMCNHSVFK